MRAMSYSLISLLCYLLEQVHIAITDVDYHVTTIVVRVHGMY